MFTQLPVVTTAQMTDIICAVQGYVSSTVPGLSVQETLGQVYNLFQANIILSYAGNPNGFVAGTTFQLLWDTTDKILWVNTTSGNAASAVWTPVIPNSEFAWTNVTGTSATMIANQGYQANNAGLVTLTLPSVSIFGDTLEIAGFGAGGWTIAQGAGQQVIIGSSSSTVGVGGSISSTNQFDSLVLHCAVANTTWQALGGPQGTLTIV
jgi:hypothetical protein